MNESKLEWNNSNQLLVYGTYIVEYYIGNTKNKEKSLVNYVDELITGNNVEVQGGIKEYMFEVFGTTEPIIVPETNLIRWIKIDVGNF